MFSMSISNKFLAWKTWQIYRGRVVPACVAIALLSILFGGALVVEHSLSVDATASHLPTKALNAQVFTNLFAASLLMFCHAIYLTLMAYHLIYRFPVEKEKWVGLAYMPIVFAYVAHARHVYLEATDQHGILEAAWWSSGAFAVTYLIMAAHGILEQRAAKSSPSHEYPRKIQQLRTKWMLGTDLAIFALTTLMFVNGVGPFHWRALPFTVSIRAVIRDLPTLSLTEALYAQASPKDVVIIFALLAYLFVKLFAQRRLRADQAMRNQGIMLIQHIDNKVPDWSAIRKFLPDSSVWLDLGSAQGMNVYELIQHIYPPNDAAFPKEIILLDKDCRALLAAPSASPSWWPTSAKQIYVSVDMRSEEAKACQLRCGVIHMGHTAYEPRVAQAALLLLRQAPAGTLLLLRYTSNTSFYRVISASTACAPLRPYTHHNVHRLLIEELLAHGWSERTRSILTRWCDIRTPDFRRRTIGWCDAQYGEFSGDIIERYLDGFAADGQQEVLNSDQLVVLEKTKS